MEGLQADSDPRYPPVTSSVILPARWPELYHYYLWIDLRSLLLSGVRIGPYTKLAVGFVLVKDWWTCIDWDHISTAAIR